MTHKRALLISSLLVLTLSLPLHAGELANAVQSKRLTGGVILLVNADSATYDEAAATGCTVRGLETDPATVNALRKRFLAKGVYGKLSVAEFDGKVLPCIDSLVNLVFIEKGQVQKAEAMRVLAPGGTALIKRKTGWKTHIKPLPAGMGEWNQFLCNADNNGVAKDNAGPPERLQWTAGSRYGRVKNFMPSVTSLVTANGRLFTVEDTATTETGQLRKKYVLLARDAFNGCELWRRPLNDWDKEKLGPVKVIPVQLQRLMLAIGDRVYCTDGYDGPVTVFDGATGDTLTRFQGTGNTREFAYEDSVIYGIKGAPYAWRTFGREAKIAKLKIDDVTLYARDAESGETLWERVIEGSQGGTEGYIGATLSIKGKRLCYMTRTKLVCLDSKTGAEIWQRDYPFWEAASREGAWYLTLHTSPPTIVMTDEQLFVAELNMVRAYRMADGANLWGSESACNYTKTGDLFFTGGLVWNTLLEGRDPATGELKRKLEQKRTGPMCHPRCYRNRITDKYYLNSLTGGTDLLALDGSAEFPGPWMRATCGLAMTPSYGRLYSSPYVCACEIGTMLLGFNCTYNQQRDKGKIMQVEPSPRLIKGPAFANFQFSTFTPPATTVSQTLRAGLQSDPWPTYRHDNARSGVTKSPIPEQPEVVWKAKLPGTPTAPVVAGGILLTAVRNQHTVYALDSRTGARKWTFTADGPVDSPPTLHRGLALFGCRSGWVYCLDAASGQLVWKFSDMPAKRLICDREQIESAWPVSGSVMVKDDLVYFAAGRSSFLDGGIVVYALDPVTGAVKHRKVMAGPYDENNFPLVQRGSQFRCEGFKSGIFSSQNDNLYIRHQGFKPDLSPIDPYAERKEHLMASTGFLCDSPQHRTYWTIDTELRYGPGGGYDTDGPHGDIIVVDGDTFHEVRGISPGRHTKNDDPLQMYRVISGYKLPAGKRGRRIGETGGGTVPRMSGWNQWARRWTTHIPIAGHAILLGGDRVAVAGVPMRAGFSPQDIEDAYEGRKGGVLWAISGSTGQPTGEIALPAPPVWDGLAAADGTCFITLKDGTVMALGESKTRKAPPTTTVTLPKPPRKPPVKAGIVYQDDFEGRKVGDVPPGVGGTDEKKGARIVVTDQVAVSGKHSLELRDAAGLSHSWQPIIEKRLSDEEERESGTMALSFDVMVSREVPGNLTVMLRDMTQHPWQSPATIAVTSDGHIQVNGKKVKAPIGDWHHVSVAFELGGEGSGKAKATFKTPAGVSESFDVPFEGSDFYELNWFGFSAMGESRGVVYVDNIALSVK
ncbi:MAG: PQQ-binding-like beta-propeller repeat protein [Kiritimatiellae bacterium]|nr:PQQ-binding-like beta-propeller repeat protein [Kiritimatiellia bacterium]